MISLAKSPLLTLVKTPRLSLKKASYCGKYMTLQGMHNCFKGKPAQHVTLAQVFYSLRKQTIEARPTICASFWRYRASGYCYINANGITKRVSTDDFFHIQQNAERRYSFWNDGDKAGSAATVRKVFLTGFGL